MLSRSIEDYIKAIYALEAEQERASTKELSQRLGVKMASVTGMIKHLASEGYVAHTPYYGVKMTERGRKVALSMIRRHRLIELFLSKTLGLTWDEVHNDAEVLEHAMSDRLIERIHEVLGYPEFDPHGSPIPSKDGSIAPHPGVRLDAMTVGQRGKIIEVYDRDPEFLRYLTKLTLKIGTVVKVREIAPFSGPITLSVGDRVVPIGPDAAARIRVAVEADSTRARTRTRRAD